MRSIKELVDSNPKRVYVYLKDEKTATAFVKDAMTEGYTYEDGVALSKREPDDFYAVNRNKTINFVNGIGRIAFQCNADHITRIDYAKYIGGEDDFLYHK